MSLALTSNLRTILRIDALVSAAAGAGLVAGSFFLSGFLGLPASLMLVSGLLLAPWTAALLVLARRETCPPGAMAAVIAVNLAWVAASLFVAFGPMTDPTLWGRIFVLAQALVVGVFAELQLLALRRTGAARARLSAG